MWKLFCRVIITTVLYAVTHLIHHWCLASTHLGDVMAARLHHRLHYTSAESYGWNMPIRIQLPILSSSRMTRSQKGMTTIKGVDGDTKPTPHHVSLIPCTLIQIHFAYHLLVNNSHIRGWAEWEVAWSNICLPSLTNASDYCHKSWLYRITGDQAREEVLLWMKCCVEQTVLSYSLIWLSFVLVVAHQANPLKRTLVFSKQTCIMLLPKTENPAMG